VIDTIAPSPVIDTIAPLPVIDTIAPSPVIDTIAPSPVIDTTITPLPILKDCGALLEGHFLLSSGRHSDKYFQCARLLQYPDRAALVLAPVAEAIRAGAVKIDAVVGPAIGGILVAYELGRLLGVPAFFTERDSAGAMTLRRGFEVTPGMSLLIAEDVVTTGKSSGECRAVLEAAGGLVTAVACVVDRRASGTPLFPFFPDDIPLYAAVKVTAANWAPAECVLCSHGLPLVKPGSNPRAGC
jgi:orotate phosphoribosyltransferase